MKNKKLKGFTLIELIIVLAIFALILTLVMSFIDPVAKVMKTASTRERTAAYVDNISEYIDNSLHYSKYMRVYNGSYCDETGDNPLGKSPDFVLEQDAESEAIRRMIDDLFNGAVNSDGDPLKGQVRVLKFINTPIDYVTIDGVNGGTLEEGQIYEDVYSFTAGWNIVEKNEDGSETPYGAKSQVLPKTGHNLKPVINPEHRQDYNYYFNLGYYTLDSIKDAENYYSESDSEKSYESKPKEYYSKLNQISSMEIKPNETFCMNVVAYTPGNKELAKHKIDDTTVEDEVLFKSPAHLSSASMALSNIIKANNASEVRYVKLKREKMGDTYVPGDVKEYEAVTALNTGLPYRGYTPKYTENVTDNIYILYIMPEEIYDSTVIYN